MGLFLWTKRVSQIIREKSDINYKLNDLYQQKMDLQNHAATIASGNITMNDLSQVSGSLFERMVSFINSTNSTCYQAASTQMSMVNPAAMMNITDATMQQQFQQSIFSNFYQQQMNQCIQAETKALNVKETKIEQEIKKLETNLSMLDQEEQTAQGALDQAAQKTAPKYVA